MDLKTLIISKNYELNTITRYKYYQVIRLLCDHDASTRVHR